MVHPFSGVSYPSGRHTAYRVLNGPLEFPLPPLVNVGNSVVCPTVAPPGVPCVKSPRVRCFTPVARCARDCFGDTPPGDSPKWAHPGRAPPCGSPNPGVECLTWAPFRVGNKTARVGIPKPAESSCVPATFLRFREPPGPNRSPSPGPKLARFPVTESLLNPYPRSRNFPD